MVVRAKEAKMADAFKGCDPDHKKELFEIVSDYDELFQELRGFPPKSEIQHEIHLS